MGEPKDAAFASRWGSAAMETDLDLSVIPYLPCCFYFHRLGRGQGIYFLSDMLIIFCLLFFFSFDFSVRSRVLRRLSTGNVILYFHSCGIVGIQMAMIKLNCMLNVELFSFVRQFLKTM